MARNDNTSRRRFLLGTGLAIGTAGLAGCGIPGGGGEEGEDDEEDDDDEEDNEEEQLQGPESG